MTDKNALEESIDELEKELIESEELEEDKEDADGTDEEKLEEESEDDDEANDNEEEEEEEKSEGEEEDDDVLKGEKKDDDEEEENHAKNRIEDRRTRDEVSELRTELADLRAERKAEKEAAEAKTKDKEQAASDPQPDKAEDPDAWYEWKDRQNDKRMAAIEAKESQRDEDTTAAKQVNQQQQDMADATAYVGEKLADYAREKDDALEVFNHLEDKIKENIRFTQPGYNNKQLRQAANYQLMLMAKQLHVDGKNIAEELYKKGAEDFKPAKTGKKSLKKINKNKGKSGSLLGSGGKSGGSSLTLDDYDQMTLAEKMNVSTDDMMRLEEDLLED